MGLFSRKKTVKPQPVEERSTPLGGLLWNTISSFSESKAMKLSAFYCGVNLISNSIAELPINVVKWDFDERRPLDHPLWRFLNVSPDGKFTHFNAFKSIIESVIIQGNGYMYIERDSRLNVKALHLLNPDFVMPLLGEGGKVVYNVAGMKEPIPASDMLHFFMHCDEMYNGISLLRYAYNCLQSATNADNTSDKFYTGGAGLNGILKAAATLTKDQKNEIRENWRSAFQTGGGGVAVLPQGIDFQAVSVSPKDAELLESRAFNIEEIARFLNIPPAKLGVMKDVNYNSMSASQLWFLSDCLQPYTQMIVEEFNRKVFKPSEVGKYGIMFDFTSLFTTNQQEKGEYFRMLITNGIMSINEVRGQLGLPKLDTEGSDSHFMQLSYQTIDNIASGKLIKGQDQGTDEQDPNTAKTSK